MSNIRAGMRVRGNSAADILSVLEAVSILPHVLRGVVAQLSLGMSRANEDGEEDVAAMPPPTSKRMEHDAAARVADMMIRPTPKGILLPLPA